MAAEVRGRERTQRVGDKSAAAASLFEGERRVVYAERLASLSDEAGHQRTVGEPQKAKSGA